jgi:hypothetical protein
MSGEMTRSSEQPHNQPVPTGAGEGGQVETQGDRTGPYGGDDGAIEHERAEMEAPDTLTPEDTGSKVEPSRKSGR